MGKVVALDGRRNPGYVTWRVGRMTDGTIGIFASDNPGYWRMNPEQAYSFGTMLITMARLVDPQVVKLSWWQEFWRAFTGAKGTSP